MTKTMLWTRSLRYGPAGFALIVALLGFVAALQFDSPADIPAILPFSESFYARAQAATNPDQRIELARKTVLSAPGRAENWVLLATAFQAKDKALSARVLRALRSSYAIGPLSPDAHEWRMEYVFSNWSVMPADLRADAMTEADAYVTRYAGYTYIKAIVPTLRDPDGRVALGLVVMTFDSERRSDQRKAEYQELKNGA